MRAKTFIFTLLAVFGPLLLIEGAIRLVLGPGIDRQMAFHQILRDEGGKIFRRVERDGRQFFYSNVLPSRYYRAAKFDRDLYINANRSPSTYRILTLGGSSAAGSPFGHWASFSRFLKDALLSVADPETTVEVVNLGASAASSSHVRLILEEAIFLEPDLVIVYSGHNEIFDTQGFDYTDRKGQSCSLERFFDSAESIVVDYSYTYRALLIFVGHLEKWLSDGSEPKKARSGCRGSKLQILVYDDADLRAVLKRYDDNVAAIIETSRRVGADVLLLSQPVNLLYEPGDFADVPAEHEDIVSDLRESFRKQRWDKYERSKTELLKRDPSHPAVPFYDALRALNAGDGTSAKALFDSALRRNRKPNRFNPEMGEVLRDLALSSPGVDFVDIREKADALLLDGIVDGRIMADLIHPTIELNRFIAQSIVDDYFLALQVRPDLFDYDRYSHSVIYIPVPEERYYGLICRRYYENEEWSDCVQEALDRWSRAAVPTRIDEHRRASRAWELLFYYGRVSDAPEMIDAALEIFVPRTPVLE